MLKQFGFALPYAFLGRSRVGRFALGSVILARTSFVSLSSGEVAGSIDSKSPQQATNPVTAGGSISSRRPLTLSEAQRLAFERNWDLLAVRSDVEIATARQLIARQYPNPSLSLSASKVNFDRQPSHTVLGNGLWDRSYDTICAVSQLLEIGGKRMNRRVSSEAEVRGAKARLDDARRLLNLGVTKAYIGSLQASANVRILQESVESLRREAELARVRLQAGDISKADESQIEITADRFELDARKAEAEARNARIDVEILLGERNPTGEWVPANTLEELRAELVPTEEPVPTVRLRPDIQAAHADQEKAEAELQLQKSLRVPDPTISTQYEHEPADKPNTVGIGLSFPLPLWNRNRGAIAVAAAARDQSLMATQKVVAQAIAEVTQARISYEMSLRRLDRYTTEIQPRSAEIRSTVSFAYQKGGASLIDLLSAERNDNDIRLAAVQARADSAIAAASLQSALGSTQNHPDKKL